MLFLYSKLSIYYKLVIYKKVTVNINSLFKRFISYNFICDPFFNNTAAKYLAYFPCTTNLDKNQKIKTSTNVLFQITK